MTKFIFTCEHGGNLIPDEFSKLFKTHSSLLNSHRGYDLGILEVFNLFTKNYTSPTFHTEISRLLIEFNRSLHHKDLFSFITKSLDKNDKQKLINNYYLPYRENILRTIDNYINKKHKVIHIAFHSFTPVLNGKIRNAEIGLLYDPRSINEKTFCKEWKRNLLQLSPEIKVRFNYPYLGIADGLTSYLRKIFGYNNYEGIELEINQKLLTSNTDKDSIARLLIQSIPNQ